jgi:O-antigen ligase
MNRPLILLFVLLVTVPLLVGGAGVASLLLLRAGYGVLVWGLVPFLVLLLLAGVLAVVIGKAARVTRDDDPKGER